MKVSTLFFAASLLASVSAQDGDSTTLILTESPTTTTDAPETLVTLPPASCASAGFESCYQILALLTPTVYVIVTADTTIADAEPITSGDPVLTQTDNIATGSESLRPPLTASVAIYYSESLGTTCITSTATSVLTDNGDSECFFSTVGFFSPPDAVTKTRVLLKAREDDSENKGTETGGGGGQTSATAVPGGTTENIPAVTTAEPVPTGDDTPTEPAPTDDPAPAPTTEDGSQPTEGPTEGPVEEPTEEPTGQDETGKPEVTTSFTTIAEVSGSSTRFVTSAVATMTRSAPASTTSNGGSGPNYLVKAQVLFGAVGLAAVVGL
ncbi:hypothetical protein TWF281_008625 [Arthrobotrys megalospora]